MRNAARLIWSRKMKLRVSGETGAIQTVVQRKRLNSLKRSAGGTGLGLAISKSLIEGQGGTIISETEVGFGTTLSVSLLMAA